MLAQKRFSITSVWKIKFLKTICHGLSTGTHASVPRPVKELKGFAKVNLEPGETKRMTLTLDRRAFSFYDVGKKDWSAEPGDFIILVGSAADDIKLRSKFVLTR